MLDFTRSEQLTLRAWYGTTTSARLAAILRRTPEEIHAEAVRLGLRSPTKASLAAIEASEAKEVAYRKRNLAEMAHAARLRSIQQAEQLNRPIAKSRAEIRAEKEAAAKAKNEAMEARNKLILAEFPHETNRVLAKRHGIGIMRIQQLASEHGVKKTARFMAQAKKNKPHHIAMRQAAELLRAGDHVGALNVLEGAL